MEWLDLLLSIQVDKSFIRTNGKQIQIIQMGNQQAKRITYDKIRKEFKSDKYFSGGYYSVCIDNQFSRFAGKLVNLYITVVKYDDWERFTKEIEDLNLNMQNFTQVVQTVETNLNVM